MTAIAASSRSAGKTYEEAIGGRWALDVPMPGEAKDMVVLNAEMAPVGIIDLQDLARLKLV